MTWLSRYWLHLLGAAAIVYFGIAIYGHGLKQGRTEVLADWTASQLAAERAVRELESTWQGRVQTARTQADEKLQAVSDRVGAVTANNERLLAAARATGAKLATCENSAAPKGSRSPGDMLADVLDRVGKRAGELAAYADRERIAREECQSAWPK